MGNQPDFDQRSMHDAMRLANSEQGRQLLAALQSSHGKQMDQAFALAAAGDYTQLKKAVEKLLSEPDAKAMLDRLRG